MALNDKELSFDNNDGDNGYITTVDRDSITNKVHGKQINNTFQQPIDVNHGATGSVFKEDGILYRQKCLHGEYYYTPMTSIET